MGTMSESIDILAQSGAKCVKEAGPDTQQGGYDPLHSGQAAQHYPAGR